MRSRVPTDSLTERASGSKRLRVRQNSAAVKPACGNSGNLSDIRKDQPDNDGEMHSSSDMDSLNDLATANGDTSVDVMLRQLSYIHDRWRPFAGWYGMYERDRKYFGAR